MIYFDLTDLVEFSRYSNNVSGIQRVIMNVAAEIEHEPETRFIYRNQIDGKFYEISDLKISDSKDLTRLKKYNNWKNCNCSLNIAVKLGKGKKLRKKIKIYGRCFISKIIHLFRGAGNKYQTDFSPKSGDFIAIFSIPKGMASYKQLYSDFKDVKFVCFFHDIIPVRTPEFALKPETDNFVNYIKLMNSTASLILTSASFNVADYKKYIKDTFKEETQYPVKAIGLPVDFDIQYTTDDYGVMSPISRRLQWYNYCLCVGTIGPRKNHFELLQAWKKFYESDEYNNQLLVIAGAPWETASDIVDILHSHFCGGSVVFIESPCDKELSYLYDKCKFTVYLSLYEGWGLPVSESISIGKPAVIINETTLPEAGYGVANIVRTRNLKDMQNEISRLFNDKDYYKSSVNKVLSAKKSFPTWASFAKRVIREIESIK